MKIVVSEGVREIWLSSEDTGAYGNFSVQIVIDLRSVTYHVLHSTLPL